jgi:hypothetical protein
MRWAAWDCCSHSRDQRRPGMRRARRRSVSRCETHLGLCDRLDYALLGLIVGRTFLLGAIGEAGVVAVQLALARRAGAWMAQQLRRRLSRESLSVPATAAARLSASQFAWATIGEADVARITRCRGRRGQRMTPQVRMIDDFGSAQSVLLASRTLRHKVAGHCSWFTCQGA